MYIPFPLIHDDPTDSPYGSSKKIKNTLQDCEKGQSYVKFP